MSIQVLLRDYPSRALALVNSTHALVIRHSPPSISIDPTRRASSEISHGTSRCIAEFAELSNVDLSDYRSVHARPVKGTLGLITISHDIFLCVVTGSNKTADVRPGETVEVIHAVQYFCLNTSDYDTTYSVDDYGAEHGIQNVHRRDLALEHPCLDQQKLLSNGSFYYSTDFDLTNRLQDRSADSFAYDIDNLDDSYLWNSFMIKPLVDFRNQLAATDRDALDQSRILTSAIRGYVQTATLPIASDPITTIISGPPATLTIISRLSCRRAGTRFNSRGIDDDGNVANFVETEIVYTSPSGITFSYVQVRGSVPVFWEQAAGFMPGQQKISITRSKEGSQPAFDKHFEDLEKSFGAVHIVNLLSATKPGEAQLTQLYQNAVRHSHLNATGSKGKDHQMLLETDFDFHAETKVGGYDSAIMIQQLLQHSMDGFAYYLSEDIEDPKDAHPGEESRKRTVVVLQQEGVFRTNCLDCLDRTNLIQGIIARLAVEAFLEHRSVRAQADFWMRLQVLWADNGDQLSKIYAGTGALKTSFTRYGKQNLAGAASDLFKSGRRLIENNFNDDARQRTMEILLGRVVGQVPVVLYDPINDYVNTELAKRAAEYSSSKIINIFVGTFNLNGKTHGLDEDLTEWLCPEHDRSKQPELVVVGFQEIVELSPQQIMNSDPTRRQAWEKAVKRCLNTHAKRIGGENYVLLRSGQLVGAALCVYVRASSLSEIKNVEGSLKKTGMSGMAGNKGAVAIRMDYANTKICFVTAHLAAGFANYDERNRDYQTIQHGLRFQRNRGIDDHDTVVWLGDFNYRIGMGVDRVKSLIHAEDLEGLCANDQLNIQMVAGLTFPHYSESRITFMPTYKFDPGTDNYDSSEKARIPAWTDRILRKGSNIKQTSYCAAPLRFSDHRPVFATFVCSVNVLDFKIKEQLMKSLFEKRRGELRGDTGTSGRLEDTSEDEDEDEDFINHERTEIDLPSASTATQKWWLENGASAKSTIQLPAGHVLDSARPSNPFTPASEPRWVKVPRYNAPLQSARSQSHSPGTQVARSATVPVLRKNAPPPIIRKPQHLSGSTTDNSLSKLSTTSPAVSSAVDLVPPPPPPRRTNGVTKAVVPPSSQRLDLLGDVDDELSEFKVLDTMPS